MTTTHVHTHTHNQGHNILDLTLYPPAVDSKATATWGESAREAAHVSGPTHNTNGRSSHLLGTCCVPGTFLRVTCGHHGILPVVSEASGGVILTLASHLPRGWACNLDRQEESRSLPGGSWDIMFLPRASGHPGISLPPTSVGVL